MSFPLYHKIGFNFLPGECQGRQITIGGGSVLRSGMWRPVADARITLEAAATHYIEVDADGNVSSNNVGFTSGRDFLFIVTTVNGVVDSIQDCRFSGLSYPVASFPTITLTALPASASGLTTGQLWSNSGVVTVV